MLIIFFVFFIISFFVFIQEFFVTIVRAFITIMNPILTCEKLVELLQRSIKSSIKVTYNYLLLLR